MCAILGWDCSVCLAKAELAEANQDNNAWSLHEDDRIAESKIAEHHYSEPSQHDWVASETIRGTQGKRVIMIEEWDDACTLQLMTIKFIEPTEQWWMRDEFLAPIVQLTDRIFDTEYEVSTTEVVCQDCHYVCNASIACPNCELVNN